MRTFFAIPIAMLAMLALAPRPVAASTITYDFAATLDHGPLSDPGNTAVTGQFTIDFNTATITAYEFLIPGGGVVDPGQGYTPFLFTYTPAVSPADNFVQLAFENGNSGGTLWLLFRTTLDAFDGNTFYPGYVEVDGGATNSGFVCRYDGCGANFGGPFVSGGAAPAGPPPPPVPEPAALALLGGGLVALAARRRARSGASDRSRC
jgi:hypothetical protein